MYSFITFLTYGIWSFHLSNEEIVIKISKVIKLDLLSLSPIGNNPKNGGWWLVSVKINKRKLPLRWSQEALKEKYTSHLLQLILLFWQEVVYFITPAGGRFFPYPATAQAMRSCNLPVNKELLNFKLPASCTGLNFGSK